MKRVAALLVLAGFLMTAGCSVAVVPRPTDDVRLDPLDNSLVGTKNGVTVQARLESLAVAPYVLQDNVSSFFVTVQNDTSAVVSVPLQAFLLVTDEGRQLAPLDPSSIHELVSRESFHLIPYPYVGYYYLEDRERGAFFNTFESALPFFAENHPQDLVTEALPQNELVPGAKFGGVVYFPVDFTRESGAELRVYLPGSPRDARADFVFPFFVEK